MSQKRRCWASSDGIHETLTSERVWGRGYSCRLCIKKWQMRLTRLHLRKRCSTDSEFLWHMTQVSIALCMLQPFLARLISVRILSSRANQQKSVILLGLGSFQKWGYKGLRRPPSTKNDWMNSLKRSCYPLKSKFWHHPGYWRNPGLRIGWVWYQRLSLFEKIALGRSPLRELPNWDQRGDTIIEEDEDRLNILRNSTL